MEVVMSKSERSQNKARVRLNLPVLVEVEILGSRILKSGFVREFDKICSWACDWKNFQFYFYVTTSNCVMT